MCTVAHEVSFMTCKGECVDEHRHGCDDKCQADQIEISTWQA